MLPRFLSHFFTGLLLCVLLISLAMIGVIYLPANFIFILFPLLALLSPVIPVYFLKLKWNGLMIIVYLAINITGILFFSSKLISAYHYQNTPMVYLENMDEIEKLSQQTISSISFQSHVQVDINKITCHLFKSKNKYTESTMQSAFCLAPVFDPTLKNAKTYFFAIDNHLNPSVLKSETIKSVEKMRKASWQNKFYQSGLIHTEENILDNYQGLIEKITKKYSLHLGEKIYFIELSDQKLDQVIDKKITEIKYYFLFSGLAWALVCLIGSVRKKPSSH